MSLPEIAGLELQELVGQGSCGTVYRAVNAKGKPCAVKVFSSMAIHRQRLASALGTLQQLPAHRGVLAVERFSLDKSPYFTVMPLVGVMIKESNGKRRWQTPTLESLLSGEPPETAWRHIHELAKALAWLHQFGLPHGNLRPCNVLLEEDPECSIRLTDVAQGWVGGIHHFELADHYVHLCPDQIENPDGVFAGRGTSWDVYAFGVCAYRLLTGHVPRAATVWQEQQALVQQRMAAGLASSVPTAVMLAAVRAQPKIAWPHPAASKWEERRRNIIERALDLNAAARWTDAREVVRAFEILESDCLLEEFREQTMRERVKQVKRIRVLQAAAVVLLTGLLLVTIYGYIIFRRAQKADLTLQNIHQLHQSEIDARESRLAALTRERDTARNAKITADANLQNSQNVVDRFLSQLLETSASHPDEMNVARERLQEALSFFIQGLTTLEADPALGLERLRVYGNIGQICLRLHDDAKAATYLTKAREQASELMPKSKDSAQAPLLQQRFGRSSLLLSELRAREGRHGESLALLRDAMENLESGLLADPENRFVRSECARALLDFGRRSLQNGDVAEAEAALARIPVVLDPKHIGSDLNQQEAFILARAKFAQGITQRDAGKAEQALSMLIDGVKDMGALVRGRSPRNQDQALQLAEAYTELAELIARNFSAADAKEAHHQAVPILLELNRLLPEWAEAKYLLARNYGALAALSRDAGQPGEASKKKQDAILLVNEILADDKTNTRYQFLLAKLRGEYAEIVADLGKASAALPIAKQAVELLQSLIGEQADTQLTPERKMWQSQLAQLHGILGHTSEAAGQKSTAREAFQSAVAIWEKLAAAPFNDEGVQTSLKWSKDRLARLK